MAEAALSGIRACVPAPGRAFEIACRGCGGHRVELFLDLGDQPHCNRLVRPDLPAGREPSFPLRAGFCHDCTLVQIDHTIPKAQMFTDYPYVSGTTRTLVEHFERSAARLVDRLALKAGNLVVDIGSNDGSWLKHYPAYGLRVLGIEAAGNVAALATQAGIPTLNRFFDEGVAREIIAAHGPASLVTAAGVFFHLEDLHSVIEGIDRLIGEKGTFVVQAIYLARMIENRAFDQIYHEHLCFYTLRSLQALLGRHGLEIVDAEVMPIHGSSLEATIMRRGTQVPSPRVAALAAEEAAGGFGEIATYRTFAEDVVRLGHELRATLEGFRQRGQRVWAYGAPAKGATLLNSFAIGPNLVQRAVEKNRMKVGLAIPGCRIPIHDEEGERPDAYLMLAWNFLEEFLAKEAAYLGSGGSFIVPVPKLQVIGPKAAAS